MTSTTMTAAEDPRIQGLLDSLHNHGAIEVDHDTFTDPIGSLVAAVEELLGLEADLVEELLGFGPLVPVHLIP